jgi:hypothetical protein
MFSDSSYVKLISKYYVRETFGSVKCCSWICLKGKKKTKVNSLKYCQTPTLKLASHRILIHDSAAELTLLNRLFYPYASVATSFHCVSNIICRHFSPPPLQKYVIVAEAFVSLYSLFAKKIVIRS